MNDDFGRIASLHPNEGNKYSLFVEALELDALVFFHASPKKNLRSIIKHGFKSSSDMGTGQLASV